MRLVSQGPQAAIVGRHSDSVPASSAMALAKAKQVYPPAGSQHMSQERHWASSMSLTGRCKAPCRRDACSVPILYPVAVEHIHDSHISIQHHKV